MQGKRAAEEYAGSEKVWRQF
ncbi:hypothetical protein EVA_17453, partial [gut metagenome]